MKLLITDSNGLAEAAINGNLNTRADAMRHNGDFQKIVQGINSTLDAIDCPYE